MQKGLLTKHNIEQQKARQDYLHEVYPISVFDVVTGKPLISRDQSCRHRAVTVPLQWDPVPYESISCLRFLSSNVLKGENLLHGRVKPHSSAEKKERLNVTVLKYVRWEYP